MPAFNDLRWACLAKFGVFWTGLGTVLGTVSGTELIGDTGNKAFKVKITGSSPAATSTKSRAF
jgi:hypothetical protein